MGVAPLARGARAAEGFVLVTEEEIFGPRAHRASGERKRSARAFLEDLRALDVGDYVVHVEHGIGRYLGLEHKRGRRRRPSICSSSSTPAATSCSCRSTA